MSNNDKLSGFDRSARTLDNLLIMIFVIAVIALGLFLAVSIDKRKELKLKPTEPIPAVEVVSRNWL